MIGCNSLSRAVSGTEHGVEGGTKPLRCRWQGQPWLSARALQGCRQHVALPLSSERKYSLGRQVQMCCSRHCSVPSCYYTQLNTRLCHLIGGLQKHEDGARRRKQQRTVTDAAVRDNPQNVDDPQVCIHGFYQVALCCHLSCARLLRGAAAAAG